MVSYSKDRQLGSRRRRLTGMSKEQHDRLTERCKGSCEQCGERPDWRGLVPHHIVPKGLGGSRRAYPDSEYQMLCGRCHNLDHDVREV